jgi:hypothetical protein
MESLYGGRRINKHILFYSIIFCSVLFCSVLFYSILFYSILFYSILFYFQRVWPISGLSMDDTEYLPSEEDLQASHIQGTGDRERSVNLVHFQNCQQGCGSGPVPYSGFVILFVKIRQRILPSASKKIKKNLDFYSFVTFLIACYLWKLM